MKEWFPRPKKPDPTYARTGEGTVSWLRRSTLPLADDCREFLDRNLAALPEECRNGIYRHLRHEQHYRAGFFELIVARSLQELGASIECEPEGLPGGKKPDFVARFSDQTVIVEAVSPQLDKELAAVLSPEVPVWKLIEETVPRGWAADIKELPRVGPNDPRRHIKAFLRREMAVPPPTNDDEEVEIRGSFEQGKLRVVLFPLSRHGLSEEVKIAIGNAVSYFPEDQTPLRNAVKKKRDHGQLRNLDALTLVALNMFSLTAEREDLDEALFGNLQGPGLFAGGEGEPTISGVLAFPEVGFLRCADPILWAHPRFSGPNKTGWWVR